MLTCIFLTHCLILLNKVTRGSTAAEVVDCRRALDVVFLLDASSDVTSTDWISSVDLVTQVSSQLNVSTSGSHVGLVMFAANTSIVQPLTQQPPTLNNLSTTSQRGRHLATAMLNTQSAMFNNKRGDRPQVADVLVIITHGVSDQPQSSVTAAERLKSDGMQIITVGIGSHGVDEMRQELRSIATYPRDTDKLIHITLHQHYRPSFIAALLAAICRRAFDAAEGTVRLADESAASGRLEMFVHGEWGTVCSTSWTRLNTHVACRELGFPAGLSWHSESYSVQGRSVLGNVSCGGDESRLSDCARDGFFVVDSDCQHGRADVYISCLCAQCNDYRFRDNVRLMTKSSSVYGRLQVFSPEHRWGGICRNGWTSNNTRVACRELGFLDGAGTYNDAERQTILVLDRVNCTGDESSLFDCDYHTLSTRNNCSSAVNVMCQCSSCLERYLLQSPREIKTTMGSRVQFEWKLNKSADGEFELWFLSRKNRRLIVRRSGELLTVENTELQNRLTLIGDNMTTLGFSLSNVSRADMGVYALHVPNIKLFNSQAVLFLTDFAVVPDPVVRREVHGSVELSWDLTALRQLRDINHEILLTTPATGRLQLDYYYTHWLRENPHRHHVTQPPDQLHLTISIDDVTMKDAGNYVIEVMLTSSAHQWLNSSWQFATSLLLVDSKQQTASQSHSVVVLTTLLAVLSLIVGGLLVRSFYLRYCRGDDSQTKQRAVGQLFASSKRRRTGTSRRYAREDVLDDYNVTEMYGGSVEMSTENNNPHQQQQQQQQVSGDSTTIDINIDEESPNPATVTVMSRSESSKLRRSLYANSSRRAK